MLRTLLMIMAAMVVLPLGIRAQSVDEIIAKNIQAHGGMEKLKLVQTIRTRAKFSQGSFRAVTLQDNKRPDKVREELILQGLVQVQAYDGKAGWQVNPFQGRKDAELLSKDDTKSLQVDADIDGPLVDYKLKGHKAELVGHDPVEGTDCYKIKLTLKNGDVRIYYLDADSFLELKVETQTMIRGSLQENETYYGDYEEVGGIEFPFEVESNRKGDPDRQELTVEKVELNAPLDDARFSVPASKPEVKAVTGK